MYSEPFPATVSPLLKGAPVAAQPVNDPTRDKSRSRKRLHLLRALRMATRSIFPRRENVFFARALRFTPPCISSRTSATRSINRSPAHKFFGPGHMSEEEDANAGCACGLQRLNDPRGNLFSLLDLLENTDLHVVDEERHALAVADFLTRLGDSQSEGVFHRGPSADRSLTCVFGTGERIRQRTGKIDVFALECRRGP